VKTRNLPTSRAVARSKSVRAITLALLLSLVTLTPTAAFALDVCEVDGNNVVCVTGKASSLQVVVNKARPLTPKEYSPENLTRIPKYNPLGVKVRKETSAALVKLGDGMKAAGYGTLWVRSGYRSFNSQVKMHKAKIATYGKTKGELLAARPGYSEHQTGLALDLGVQGSSTIGSTSGNWLARNCYKYGFVVRYPYGKTKITGYSYEPWHFRYVGVEVSKAMHKQKISTLEEYYSLPAAPGYVN
jgi:D-alanyl-D-alanine carboxypeptidase